MEIKQFKFTDDKGKVHEFTWNDEGFINATEAYKEWGKSQQAFSKWHKTVLIPYAERLIELNKNTPQPEVVAADYQSLTINDIIVVKIGGTPHEQGTWLHPDLVNVFARWIDTDFEIWCDKMITKLLDEGHVELDEEGLKYAADRKKLLDSCYTSSHRFVPVLREMIEIHDKQGYNIREFDRLMGEISKQLNKDNRVKMYDKIIAVIEELYQTDKLDITTREAMKQRVYNRIFMVLKTRATKATNELKSIAKAVPDQTPAVNPDVESHNQLVALTEELKETKEALEHERKKADGIAEGTIIDDMFIPVLDPARIVPSKIEAERTLKFKGYKIIYSDYLMDNSSAKATKPGAPNFVGSKEGDGIVRRYISLWDNAGQYTFKLSTPKPNGPGFDVRYCIYLGDSDSNFTWKGFNKDKTICALYNEATHLLLVFAAAKKVETQAA